MVEPAEKDAAVGVGSAALGVGVDVVGFTHRGGAVATVPAASTIAKGPGDALSGGEEALFASEAVKCYYSTPFRIKIIALFFATIFTYGVRNRVALAEEGRVGSASKAIVAVLSIGLWFTVAAAGRWIGFSG